MNDDMSFDSIPYDGTFAGARNGNNRFYLLHSYPGCFTMGYGELYTSNVSIQVNKRYNINSKLSVGEQFIKVDNEVVISNNIVDEKNLDLNLYLFAMNQNGSPTFGVYAKIYSLSIKYNDQLVRDYIPVLDSGNRPCLFDKVEKKCYYNQGTGEFLYG